MCRDEATEDSTVPVTGQASVPWSQLKLDLALIVVAVLIVVTSLIADVVRSEHDYFQRSGALMVLFSGYLAYRGINKYWVKAENSFSRGYWLRTSQNQRIVDAFTLILSLFGTVIWGYGDKLFCLVFACDT